MHVSSNLRAISAGFLCIFLMACEPSAKKAEPSQSVSLSEQIAQIEIKAVPFDELPGETRAEKLLYQAGIVSQMQTASLVMLDTQIKTIELSGNQALAKELRDSRELLMDALVSETPGFVSDAASLYDTYFTPEEIERLIVIHGDPVMQKLIQNQTNISSDVIPAATAFGERAGAKFQAALSNRNKDVEP